ncbi:unnamed protein product [Albugo candida]|uniref:5'-3' exoribonuclease n=1 Tax=Albugo candida TaxID=65357 RepID=A0A024GJM0_9STRA|nr:unnamed protein product [Albugo candida]|eukprot:CCI46952.1 unnamed protein product [Albugo candida]
MGVPAFYRWLSAKYPKCVVDCVEQSPVMIEGKRHYELLDITGPSPNEIEVANLYIDMNGLIHPCAHPENGEQPKTEEEMYQRVMDYVDRLVAAVRPRRVLYLAIDGVAPRAKMNQQRARRFRSAKEAEERSEIEKQAIDYMKAMGHQVQDEDQPKGWDSNVITPGTKFMSKLSKYLRFYIRERINQNEAWKSIKVVFSDASVPGEGEHKLMSFVRLQRSQPGYDPNQHHVLHGLDADLIMLGLATHEVNFTILREEVLFGKQKYEREKAKQLTILDANGTQDLRKRKRGEHGEHDADVTPTDQTPLQFLHIAILREYLEFEFLPLAQTLPFPYDFERIVDDFVFLCFFVGNDFLPHLPSLDIRDGALDFLILLYAKLLPTLKGYLTDSGEVNLSRVNAILAEVGAVEDEVFLRRAAKQAESERVRKNRLSNEKKDQIGAASVRSDAIEIQKKCRIDQNTATANAKYGGMSADQAIQARVKEMVDEQLDKHRQGVKDVVRLGEPGWKKRYYNDKFKADDIAHGGGKAKVLQSYVEGLCWVMKYYYSGCASWNWFYPFHYAPFASDLVDIDRFTISFDLGQPFRPFEQLMGVFPAASAHAIPKPYRWLLRDPKSPIIDFYPTEIPVDPNGKPMPWLWVVLLPFIDEARLLEAMEPESKKLSALEKKRNQRYGKEIVFFHSGCRLTKGSLPDTKNTLVELDPSISTSFSGALFYVEALHFPTGCIVPSPEKKPQHFMDISNNQCHSFQYLPPVKLPHICKLLGGAVRPQPVLISQSDLRISIPCLGRGNINITDLAGVKSGLTNATHARLGSFDRQRGSYQNGGRSGNDRPQFNQYLTNGFGQWGSQEPRSKQQKNGYGPSQSSNSYDRVRSRDRSRDRTQNRAQVTDRSQDRSLNRSRDRSRDRSQGRSRDRSQNRSRDRTQSSTQDRSRVRPNAPPRDHPQAPAVSSSSNVPSYSTNYGVGHQTNQPAIYPYRPATMPPVVHIPPPYYPVWPPPFFNPNFARGPMFRPAPPGVNVYNQGGVGFEALKAGLRNMHQAREYPRPDCPRGQ